MKFSFLLIFFSIQVYWSQAIADPMLESANLTQVQKEFIKQELLIQSIFIEGIKELEIDSGELPSEGQTTNRIKTLLERAMLVKTQSLPEDIRTKAKEIVNNGFNEPTTSNILGKLKTFINKQKSAHSKKLSSVIRRFGYDVGLVYLLTLQVDLTFPSIMIAMGHLEFAPLLAMPVSSVGTGAYIAFKSFTKTNQITKSLGGKLSAKQRRKTLESVKSFFKDKVGPKYDLISINIHGEGHALSIQRGTLLAKLKQKLGWSRDLNYENLVKTLYEEGLVSGPLDEIIHSSDLKELKLIKILNHIEFTQDEKLISVLKSQYADFIHTIGNTPELAQARDWVIKISRSNSFEEFGALMTKMPDELPPRVLDRLWREVIIPSTASSIGPFISANGFKAFKNLRELWDKNVRKHLVMDQSPSMHQSIKSLIGDMLLQSMSPVNGCSILFEPRSQHLPLL